MATFNISLTSSIQISASLSADAPDEASAIVQAASMQAAGRIRWTYRGIPIGPYRTPLGELPSMPHAWSTTIADPSTKSTLTPSALTAPYGTPVSVSVFLTSPFGLPNGGSVTLYRDGSMVASAPAVLSSAQLGAVTMNPGPHELLASYSGFEQFLPADSAPVTVTVLRIPVVVAVTVTLTAPSAQYGVPLSASGTVVPAFGAPPSSGSVLLSARPTGGGAALPLGSVVVSPGGSFIGPLGLLPVTLVAPGTWDVLAQFVGDARLDQGTGVSSGLDIMQATPVVVVGPLVPPTGPTMTNVALSATIRNASTPSAPINGQVSFYDRRFGLLAQAPIVAGSASANFTVRVPGAYAIYAQYDGGDPNYLQGAQSALTNGSYGFI